MVAADATTWAPDGEFDAILLDAPCSATGTFRRHPEVLWHRSAQDIASRVRLQRSLLANALRMLKPNGTLIYCVCSLEAAEGEDQAYWALDALPDLVLSPIRADEVPGLPGSVTPKGMLRTHPGMSPGESAGGMDGFFVARFTRKG